MAVVVYPIDAVAGAPMFSGRMARQALSALTTISTSSRPLGGRSGVRPGTSGSTVTATSTTWTVKPHNGMFDVQIAMESAAYLYAVNADITGAVTAAHATLARTDLVYMNLLDPSEGDGTTVPGATAGYSVGTAGGAAGTYPARSFVLAWINVPKSGGGAPTVTWAAPFTVASGGILPVNSQAERDAGPGHTMMTVGRRDLGTLEWWTGSYWKSSEPAGGIFLGTTDAQGFLTVPHGLPYVPTKITGTILGPADGTGSEEIARISSCTVWSRDAGNIGFRIARTDLNAWFPGMPVAISWTAR